MRLAIVVLLMSFVALFANNTDASIRQNEAKLRDISNQKNSISAKLKTLGSNINAKNAKIDELNKQIASIEKSINANEAIFVEQTKIYKESESKRNNLLIHKENLQKDLVDTILKDIAVIMMLNQHEPLDADSVMSEEILKNLSTGAKKRIDSIIKEQEIVSAGMKEAERKIENAKKVIASQIQKKDSLERAKKEQLELASKMKSELDSYDSELKRLDSERKGIQKILADLNIIKKQEQARATQPQSTQKGTLSPSIEVRQIGSSYQNVSTAKYTGSKTISPLKNGKVETKYGPYFDPVYKMRVFNESITMSVPNRSPVVSVLEGKVVFAKETAILRKVVIIEHKNSLHTIYSNLDDIPSSIKVGKSIKKGDTIAFVNSKLNFEVTQKDKHINPLDLINAK